jgi:hypothetical protein
MTWQTVYNGGDAPVVISSEGHSLGGGEWGPAQTTEDAVKSAIDAGSLVVVDDIDLDDESVTVTPAARRAFKATADIRERAESLGSYDKPGLAKLAVGGGLVSPEGAEDLNKGELERLVLRSNVTIPKKKAPAKTAASSQSS